MPDRRTEDDRRIAELIPNGLLRSGQSHHQVVLQKAMARSESAQLRLAGSTCYERVAGRLISVNVTSMASPLCRSAHSAGRAARTTTSSPTAW
jgi:D-serine deaminase-like pyridoxal phosphate-dependent protein